MTPQEYNDWAKTQVTMTIPLTIVAVSRHAGLKAVADVLAALADHLPREERDIESLYNWNDATVTSVTMGDFKKPIVVPAAKLAVVEITEEEEVE